MFNTFVKESVSYLEQLKKKIASNVDKMNNSNGISSSSTQEDDPYNTKSSDAMDPEEFRIYGKQMIDFVADYWLKIRSRKPLHKVKPGYIWDVLPRTAPEEPEGWEDIFGDLENVVLNGVTHWHHPHFFAYYPAANSYPAILGDILSDGIGCIGFTWNSSPACTELEMGVTDWVAKMLQLPSIFLNADCGPGSGMIQASISCSITYESTLVALLAARNRSVKRETISNNQIETNSNADQCTVLSGTVVSMLVAYCSDQAHSSVERAALLGGVRIRKLESNDNLSLTLEILQNAVEKDRQAGLIPFFVCATLGTTPSCAFDQLDKIGPFCQKENIYLHIDAAYAGSAFICPEYRHLLNGVEFADSFNFNAAKWLMVNMDCSLMCYWLAEFQLRFKDAREVEQAFLVDPLYLKHDYQGTVPDYRNLQIPLGRRFRSLKLWFVLRSMGVKKLQNNIRKMCHLAKQFEALVKENDKFEVVAPVVLGLVCFRLKETNEMNQKLLNAINQDRRIHLVPSELKQVYILRFAICSTLTTSEDIAFAWNVICELADRLN